RLRAEAMHALARIRARRRRMFNSTVWFSLRGHPGVRRLKFPCATTARPGKIPEKSLSRGASRWPVGGRNAGDDSRAARRWAATPQGVWRVESALVRRRGAVAPQGENDGHLLPSGVAHAP